MESDELEGPTHIPLSTWEWTPSDEDFHYEIPDSERLPLPP